MEQKEPLSLYNRVITDKEIINLIGSDTSNDWWLYGSYVISLGVPWILATEAGMSVFIMLGMYLILAIVGIVLFKHIKNQRHIQNKTSWAEKHFRESQWFIFDSEGFSESVGEDPVVYSIRVGLKQNPTQKDIFKQEITYEEYQKLCAGIPYSEGPFWLTLQYPTRSFGLKGKSYIAIDPFTTTNFTSIEYPPEVEEWIRVHKK